MEAGKLLKQQAAGRQVPHAHVSQSSGSTAAQLEHSQRAALQRLDGLGDAGHASASGQHGPEGFTLRGQVTTTSSCMTLVWKLYDGPCWVPACELLASGYGMCSRRKVVPTAAVGGS